jgi:DNA-directed RNA polymerase specialized sigma24 family protein
MHVADQPEPDPRWPERLLELCRDLRETSSVDRQNRVRGELWLLAFAAVSRYVRYHAQSGTVDPEDLKDIASEKALAFLQHASEPVWSAEVTHPGQVCSYFSTLAHNGLMDHFRSRRRWVQPSAVDVVRESVAGPQSQPESYVTRRQFADALRDCTNGLTAKARVSWFLRVMLDMSTRDIANHPGVRMNVAAVDMMLSRTRKTVRERMREKGFEPQDIPPGTLALLWLSVRRELEEGEKSG